ncbi:MAG: hypothetical protein HYY34_00660 [Chloroflexi bacterium]|nr:hypothetical protein [Chloroflexota bacterium]
MAQIYVEVEENPNCAYSPLQTFQTLEPPKTATALVVPEVSGGRGAHAVVGWGSARGGSACPVTYARVTDSGAGSSLLISGGDFGIRLKPLGDRTPWKIGAAGQWGEPYMLTDAAAAVTPIEGETSG